MALHFHTLTVKKIQKETADCVSICFEVPDALRETFKFTAGQNITLKARVDGTEIRRSYSICTAPHENELKIAVKKIPGGIFSNYANEQLQPGTVLEVLPPSGSFYTPLHSGNKKQYTAFAAGSGITPVLALIKAILHTEPQSCITLVLSNKNSRSIIFLEELQALKNKYLHRLQLLFILTQEKTGNSITEGRIDYTKMQALSKLLPLAITSEFFICGPEPMIFCIRDFLLEKGIDAGKIHFELFGAGKQQPVSTPAAVQATINSVIEIKYDGRIKTFTINNSSTILDAALREGADLPFACKGGMCCSCRARLTEGEVRMDVHWGLEEDEIKNGYILTCQSHPVTKKVTIDFDEK
ncbi:MAG TPA: 2Fe-2S iron-sulfur cluster-binding protein [Ferruginibacter sp.]|nr:2Fe-2S iron-sulfur cluster-binding protein [Ferruginibacter sp.]HMP20658.1 2Fe-2S iron-sulfur cluster-binding protein [Ferruginibacter sp.]